MGRHPKNGSRPVTPLQDAIALVLADGIARGPKAIVQMMAERKMPFAAGKDPLGLERTVAQALTRNRQRFHHQGKHKGWLLVQTEVSPAPPPPPLSSAELITVDGLAEHAIPEPDDVSDVPDPEFVRAMRKALEIGSRRFCVRQLRRLADQIEDAGKEG